MISSYLISSYSLYSIYYDIIVGSRNSIPLVDIKRKTFLVSGTKSAKGISSMVLDMSAKWKRSDNNNNNNTNGKKSYLLVFNTHLDPGKDIHSFVVYNILWMDSNSI